MNCRYIVVTPCRNEEKNLPNLVQSIAAQTIRPVFGVVVDDGSTDKTPEIIKNHNGPEETEEIGCSRNYI